MQKVIDIFFSWCTQQTLWRKLQLLEVLLEKWFCFLDFLFTAQEKFTTTPPNHDGQREKDMKDSTWNKHWIMFFLDFHILFFFFFTMTVMSILKKRLLCYIKPSKETVWYASSPENICSTVLCIYCTYLSNALSMITLDQLQLYNPIKCFQRKIFAIKRHQYFDLKFLFLI